MQCPQCKAEIQDSSTFCTKCGASVTAQPPQAGTAASQDFGALFTNATNIWKENLGDLVLLTLVFMLIFWIPIANAGFIAGYYRSILKVLRKQGKAQVGDLFNAWDCFGNLLGYLVIIIVASYILSKIPFIGFLGSWALSIAVTPGLYAIIDKGSNLIDGFKWSFETLQKDPLNWVLACIVGGALAGVGAIALLVGMIVTLSWGTLITASQYELRKAD